MSSCEKCWADAGRESRIVGGIQVEIYNRLLKEREANPCSPEEQAGQYWDKENQCDIRKSKEER